MPLVFLYVLAALWLAGWLMCVRVILTALKTDDTEIGRRARQSLPYVVLLLLLTWPWIVLKAALRGK